jgi:hypothetical protein
MNTRFDEILKELCGIYRVEPQSISADFNRLLQKLNINLASDLGSQIQAAFSNRYRNNYKASTSLKNLLRAASSSLKNDLIQMMKGLQRKFIAILISQDFVPASYHFYGHTKEMSMDPGLFYAAFFPDNLSAEVLVEIVNTLGAAHDIIQNETPYKNEKISAGIFVEEFNKSLAVLIEDLTRYSSDEIKCLQDFRDFTIPFLAEEGIVNSTFLVFSAGTRDFENILTQINKLFIRATPLRVEELAATVLLDSTIMAMKFAISLADTRRASLNVVVSKLELLKIIPRNKFNSLLKLLQYSGVLSEDDFIPELESIEHLDVLKKINSYILRLTQNVRMTSEMAARKMDFRRKEIICSLRANKPVKIDLAAHLQPFLDTIHGRFGEIEFAQALGYIDQNEILEQAIYYGLQSMVNPDTFDIHGWSTHAHYLSEFHKNLSSLSDSDTLKAEIAELIFFMAAKSPGHILDQETYDVIQSHRTKLSYTDSTQCEVLEKNLLEIEQSNPHLATLNSSANARPNDFIRPSLPRQLSANDSKTDDSEKKHSVGA